MKTMLMTAMGILLLGAVAKAQPPDMDTSPGAAPIGSDGNGTTDPSSPPGPNPALPTTARAAGMTPYMSRVGGAVLLGGGFEDFTNANLRGMTSMGGSWTARVVAGTRQVLGVEAAYIGAARSINGFGLGGDANLVSNGVEGAVRANLPLEMGRGMLEPFAFVGLGWQHYSLMNQPSINISTVSNSDDVMTLPYGAGLEFSYGMFIADARFTYRYTYLNDLMRGAGGRANTYGVTAQLGVEF